MWPPIGGHTCFYLTYEKEGATLATRKRTSGKGGGKDKDKAVQQFDAIETRKILNAIHLGGAIDEAVLRFSGDGKLVVAAMDKAGSIFAFAQGMVSKVAQDFMIGVKELPFLIRTLEAAKAEPVPFSIADPWLKMQLPDYGAVKMLLSDPDMVDNPVDDYEGPMEGMVAESVLDFDLTEEAVRKFSSFQDLVRNGTTEFRVTPEGIVVGSGPYETRTFTVELEATPDDIEPFTVPIWGAHLRAVFDVLSWSEKNKDFHPVLRLGGADSPVVITQGDDYFWGLNPMEGGGMEDEQDPEPETE